MNNELPLPIKVELLPHDHQWAAQALAEGRAIASALRPVLLAVHHIGSTAIPAIRAKPIIDLMPVVTTLSELDERRTAMETLGYQWHGELGLPGRRYCTKSDPATDRRRVQVHFYETGSPEIIRHLAFRDYLNANPGIAAAYEQEKERCQRLHPDDSHAYTDCKNAWIRRVETEALDSIGHRTPQQTS